MKRYIARHILTARLAALALSVLCLLQAPVRAQGMISVIVIFPSAGLAPGQSLRLALFNPNGSPVRAEARLHHTGGILVALGDGSVRSGAFHSFDFKRSDIPLAGEAGTGRVQLQSSVRLTFSEVTNPVAVSMEIVDVTDGTSNTVFVGEILPSRCGEDILPLPEDVAIDFIVGFVPGQTLRATFFNPSSFGPEAQRKPINGHVKVFDGSGNLIAQSAEQVIPPGEFRSFDFNRALFPLPGEPGTGRLQARFEIVANRPDSARPPSDDLVITDVVSFEVIDNRTGKTTVQAGHRCLVFYLGGIPE